MLLNFVWEMLACFTGGGIVRRRVFHIVLLVSFVINSILLVSNSYRQSQWDELSVQFENTVLIDSVKLMYDKKLDENFLPRNCSSRNSKLSADVQCVLNNDNDNISETINDWRVADVKPRSLIDSMCDKSVTIDKQKALILGNPIPPDKKMFVTIGISSIVRRDHNYLNVTLRSLFSALSDKDRGSTLIVVFLSDFDHDIIAQRVKELEVEFLPEIQQGILHVIKAPVSFYPNLNYLKLNFNDKPERVVWRAKQCVDFSFLVSYCNGLSDYYLQLDDDVVVKSGFLSVIRDKISVSASEFWVYMTFSELGSIGDLIQGKELLSLATFYMFFYEELPVDWLLPEYSVLRGQQGVKFHQPSLFQHIGLQSSLIDKKQEIIDRFFESFKEHVADNPPASVFSSIASFSGFNADLAYGPAGYFWGGPPKNGDIFVIVFHMPHKLSRLAVHTGIESHPLDIIKSGILDVSERLISATPKLVKCTKFRTISKFLNGSVDINLPEFFLHDVQCIRIQVTNPQPEWIVLREIAVWLDKSLTTNINPLSSLDLHYTESPTREWVT